MSDNDRERLLDLIHAGLEQCGEPSHVWAHDLLAEHDERVRRDARRGYVLLEDKITGRPDHYIVNGDVIWCRFQDMHANRNSDSHPSASGGCPGPHTCQSGCVGRCAP